MGEEKSEFLKGTLGMLIVRIVALEPIMATRSRNGFSSSPATSSNFSKAPYTPHFTAWRTAGGSTPNGVQRIPAGKQSSIR